MQSTAGTVHARQAQLRGVLHRRIASRAVVLLGLAGLFTAVSSGAIPGTENGTITGANEVAPVDSRQLPSPGHRPPVTTGAALEARSITRRILASTAGTATSSQRIVIENSFPGTTRWRPDPALYKPSSADVNGVIALRAYASATSVNLGDAITFYVTSRPGHAATDPVPTYGIEIYRLGYYGGTGGRSMNTVKGLVGYRQPDCTAAPPPPAGSGLVECHWSPSYSLLVPTTWTSGVYVAQIINSEGYESYVPFVVRDDNATADFLYKEPVATYQAYNNFGNRSLYKCDSSDCSTEAVGAHHGVEVSFDRPYADTWGVGQLFYRDFSEQKFIYWTEQMGYDITYSTDVDTHSNPARLLSVRGFLAVGHNEYWSRQMYDAMQAARDQGVHLGFFGGNTGYWQVRFAPSSSGAANRIIVCYKDLKDPDPDPAYATKRWRDLGRPEQTLVGVQWGNGMDYGPGPDGTYSPGTGFPLVVRNAAHWIYAGTGVREGQQIPDVIGQEWDTIAAGTPLPPNTAFTVVGHTTLPYDPKGVAGSTTIYPPPYPSTVDTVVYTSLSGALVFGASTIIWGHAMDESPVIRQMTRNLLDKFLATPPQRGDITLMQLILSNTALSDN